MIVTATCRQSASGGMQSYDLKRCFSIIDGKALQLPTKEDSSGENKMLNRLGECSAKFDELEGNFAKFPLGSAIGN